MQGDRSFSSLELTEAPIAAPLEAAWDAIRAGLRRDLGARTFDGWLKPAALGAFDPATGALEIHMPSQFMADWVRSHFGERLTLAWKTVLPIVREVCIVAVADAPRPTPLLILEDAPVAAAAQSFAATNSAIISMMLVSATVGGTVTNPVTGNPEVVVKSKYAIERPGSLSCRAVNLGRTAVRD